MADNGVQGQQDPAAGTSQFNAMAFLVKAMLSKMSTATIVKVMGVTNNGGLAATGYVNVMPLVNQVDGNGNSMSHGTIYQCPYVRIQGGANAVIIDPQVGDIGVAVFADHDISSVCANRAQANPGSWRRFDMSDAIYIGGWSGVVPTQFVQMSAAGIRISSPTLVKLDAPDIQITAGASIEITAPTVTIAASTSATVTTPTFTVNGSTVLNGTVTASGAVSAPTVAAATSLKVAGTEMAGHRHSTSSNPSGTPI